MRFGQRCNLRTTGSDLPARRISNTVETVSNHSPRLFPQARDNKPTRRKRKAAANFCPSLTFSPRTTHHGTQSDAKGLGGRVCRWHCPSPRWPGESSSAAGCAGAAKLLGSTCKGGLVFAFAQGDHAVHLSCSHRTAVSVVLWMFSPSKTYTTQTNPSPLTLSRSASRPLPRERTRAPWTVLRRSSKAMAHWVSTR